MSSSYLIDAVEDVLEAGIIKCMFQFPWLSGGIKVLNQVYNLGGAPPPPAQDCARRIDPDQARFRVIPYKAKSADHLLIEVWQPICRKL